MAPPDPTRGHGTDTGPRETDDVAGAARPAGGDFPPLGGSHEHAHTNDTDDADDARDAEEAGGLGEIEPPDEQAPPPVQVAELAAACLRFVATRYGAALDFKPDTLSFVDQ